jgi:addiction module HigA family antidote
LCLERLFEVVEAVFLVSELTGQPLSVRSTPRPMADLFRLERRRRVQCRSLITTDAAAVIATAQFTIFEYIYMSKKLPSIHPGEILLEEFLKPLDMNPHQLAMALRVPPNRIAQIIAGERAITADTALRLGRYFGVNPQFWLNLQSTHDLRAAAREHQAQIERDVQPRAE